MSKKTKKTEKLTQDEILRKNEKLTENFKTEEAYKFNKIGEEFLISNPQKQIVGDCYSVTLNNNKRVVLDIPTETINRMFDLYGTEKMRNEFFLVKLLETHPHKKFGILRVGRLENIK